MLRPRPTRCHPADARSPQRSTVPGPPLRPVRELDRAPTTTRSSQPWTRRPAIITAPRSGRSGRRPRVRPPSITISPIHRAWPGPRSPESTIPRQPSARSRVDSRRRPRLGALTAAQVGLETCEAPPARSSPIAAAAITPRSIVHGDGCPLTSLARYLLTVCATLRARASVPLRRSFPPRRGRHAAAARSTHNLWRSGWASPAASPYATDVQPTSYRLTVATVRDRTAARSALRPRRRR